MIIIGHELLACEDLFVVSNIEDINKTKANSTIIFKYNEEILKYASSNSILFAVIVNNIKEAVLCNSLEAKYIICDQNIAKSIQDIAENYMFDSKILTIIKDESQIEEIAILGIDGVIYKNLC